jgi:tetratricopeptide (TPR) repeat protein
MRKLIHMAIVLVLISTNAQGQYSYTKADSVRAAAYYDSSWRYRMGSVSHQLYLDSALAIIPTYAYYWQQKAMPLYKAGLFQYARPYMDSAVKYNPKKMLDYAAFMECIFEKNYPDALRDFMKAKALYGNGHIMDHAYNFYIGLCYLQTYRYDSAKRYMEQCVQEDLAGSNGKWAHPNNYFYLGIIAYVHNDNVAAIGEFDKALAEYPTFSDAQYYKAWCLTSLGRKTEALAMMRAADENFRQGYTFNEDNSLYVDFPYQIRRYYLISGLEALQKAEKQ